MNICSAATYYFLYGMLMHKIENHKDISEWKVVKASKPRFTGYEPKGTLRDYENEADPKVMSKKIDAVYNSGKGSFFDLYFVSGMKVRNIERKQGWF